MGTAGAFGIRVDGVDHIDISNFDSYPSNLGRRVIEFARHASLSMAAEQQRGQSRSVFPFGGFDDGADFMADSLWCEWAYVLNLDERTLEFYRGFQRHSHARGRYAGMAPVTHGGVRYFPVALLGTFSIDALCARSVDDTLTEMKRLCDAADEAGAAADEAAEKHAKAVRASALAKIATIEQFTQDEAALVRRLLEESK